jgi:triacylglycerol lipase
MFSPLSAIGPTTSPIAPLSTHDARFIENGGGGLDTGCTFRPDGPLVISLPVTRVVGATNGDGTLQFAGQMVNNGVLSAKAKLRLPAFDVDLEGAAGVPPELDFILFNGVQIGSLSGSNNTWKLNEFEVDINLVRFGTKNENGEPTPGNNEITILIDQGSGSDVNWCTAIDWVEITFKTISPVVLVHGNGQSGQFYVDTGFVSYLESQFIPYDRSISLQKKPIYTNANEIAKQLPNIVKKFGVDSIHLVAHSKGGPDTRAYLAVLQHFNNQQFKVISFNTSGSPHDGSLLADLMQQREEAANMVGKLGRIEYEGFPLFTRQMVALATFDSGLRSLTTKNMAVFNFDNVPALPRDISFTTVGGDADVNGNGVIDRFPDEYAGLRNFDFFLRASDLVAPQLGRRVIDNMYQILRNTSSISMECCESGLLGRKIAKVRAAPSAGPIPNDTLVTIPSANGVRGFQSRTSHFRIYLGSQGRNHANIADGDVAAQIVTWMLEAERNRGDLQ